MKDKDVCPDDELDLDGQKPTDDFNDELFEPLEEKVERLRGELEARTKEAEENNNRFLRACADLENYKKRSAKEKADAIAYANESIIEDVLGAVDNFERALAHVSDENSVESLKHGVQLTLTQLYATLKKYGLEEIQSVGSKFDPALHHAISHEESDTAEPEIVVREFQKGYFLKGRLLRPAMVAVSKKPEVH